MAYASVILSLSEPPSEREVDGKTLVVSRGAIPGGQAVDIALNAISGTPSGDALAAKQQGDLLIASGAVSLIDDGNLPLVSASVLCNAHPDQFLNEVCVVGRIGGEPRLAESGKSACRSIAVNRYRRPPEGEEPIEETDWYRIRGFGLNKGKLTRVDKGSLVEVSGIFTSMSDADGKPYVEIRARNIRVHRSGGGGNPAAGTSATGYDQESFMGSDDLGTNADWS